jgi:hypothetical protein
MSEIFSVQLGSHMSSAADWSLLSGESDENATDPFPTLIKGASYTLQVCSLTTVPLYCSASGRCRSATLTAADAPGPPSQVVLCSYDGGSITSAGVTVAVGPAGPFNLW